MTKKSIQTLMAGSLIVVAGSIPAIGGQLPVGVGSLTETYQDWVVACQTHEAATTCIMRQSQSNTKTGQHVLTVELQHDEKGRLQGALLMPFGLGLNHGVILTVDDKDEESPLAFATCLPAGCVAPFSPDKALLARLKVGSTLNLTAKAHPGEQAVAFKVSLNGFSAALNRISKLMK